MERYCTDFKCTYRIISEDEYDDDLYRVQIMQAFNIKEWDDKQISLILEKLQPQLEPYMQTIYSYIRNNNTYFDRMMLFWGENIVDSDITYMLFCIETFDKMHDVICNIIGKTDNIEEKVEILLNHIKTLSLDKPKK